MRTLQPPPTSVATERIIQHLMASVQAAARGRAWKGRESGQRLDVHPGHALVVGLDDDRVGRPVRRHAHRGDELSRGAGPRDGDIDDGLVDLEVVDLTGEDGAGQAVVDERAADRAVGVQLTY